MAEQAYPITYGVLGLLAFTGPTSGYDLKQVFDCTLSPLWNATHSQIYNELKRMDKLGWVEMEEQRQEGRPDKKVYSLTEAGKQAFREWQATQPASGLVMRDETLLRFIFGSFAEPEQIAQTLRIAIADHQQRLELYEQTASLLPPTPEWARTESASNEPADPYFVQLAVFSLEFERMYLEGLQNMLQFVEARLNQAAESSQSMLW